MMYRERERERESTGIRIVRQKYSSEIELLAVTNALVGSESCVFFIRINPISFLVGCAER